MKGFELNKTTYVGIAMILCSTLAGMAIIPDVWCKTLQGILDGTGFIFLRMGIQKAIMAANSAGSATAGSTATVVKPD